jgi:mxaL protein
VKSVAAALVLLILALCAPMVKLPSATFHYMVTFDITQSMSVEDVLLEGAPVSRLTLARAAMREVLRRLPCGSTIGWSIFADYRSFPLMLPVEVCANYDVLLSSLDKIDGRMRWANASNINKGIYWALRNAQSMPGTDIVFLTDGQEAPPLRAGQAPMPPLSEPEPGGWLIGVGSDLPTQIPRTDVNGNVSGFWTAEDVIQVPGLPIGQSHEHLSELREAYLISLATQNSLRYQRLTSPSSLTPAILGRLSAHRTWIPTDIRWLPAVLALLVLVGAFLPDRLSYRSWLSLLPRRL